MVWGGDRWGWTQVLAGVGGNGSKLRGGSDSNPAKYNSECKVGLYVTKSGN